MSRQKYLIAAFVATTSLGAMLLPATACERNDFYIYGNKLVADFVQKPKEVCGQSIGNSNTRTSQITNVAASAGVDARVKQISEKETQLVFSAEKPGTYTVDFYMQIVGFDNKQEAGWVSLNVHVKP